MSGKQITKYKRMLEKQKYEIKIEALKEFITFCYAHSFFGRLKIAWRIIAKRVKV